MKITFDLIMFYKTQFLRLTKVGKINVYPKGPSFYMISSSQYILEKYMFSLLERFQRNFYKYTSKKYFIIANK